MPTSAPDPDPGDAPVELKLRLERRLHERLRRRAFRDRVSMTALARDLIAAGLKPAKRAAPEVVTP